MSINPVFCNIYLWFNLSAVSFFLCVFVFHSVLLLVNSTLVIFVIPYEYFFCLLVKEINLLGWFPFAMHCQSFPWFALDFSLSFFSLSFLSFFPSPVHSFLLQTPGHFTLFLWLNSFFLLKLNLASILKKESKIWKKEKQKN